MKVSFISTTLRVLKIQLLDYDSEDDSFDPIATFFLNLDSISYESDDEYGKCPRVTSSRLFVFNSIRL